MKAAIIIVVIGLVLFLIVKRIFRRRRHSENFAIRHSSIGSYKKPPRKTGNGDNPFMSQGMNTWSPSTGTFNTGSATACSRCHGTGKVESSCPKCSGAGRTKCRECWGFGTTRRNTVEFGKMVVRTSSCMGCGGRGKTTCKSCGGTGKSSMICPACNGSRVKYP